MSTRCNPDWKTAYWAFYRYEPSMVAAVIFCVLFLIVTLLHSWQMWKTKTWFLTALVIGCFFEIIGFGARTSSARQEAGCWTSMPYIIQSMFILLAPALFAASIYIILGRIILVTDGEQHSIVKQRWLTKTFVSGDILCFSLQSGGGGLIAAGRNSKTLGNIGNGVIIAGLVLQLLWFIVFMIVASIFHLRMRKVSTATSQQPEVRWQSYLHTLYFVSGLIVIRSLFRVIEYAQGNNGRLMHTETFLYVFDAVPMFIVVAWFLWKHPSEIGMLLKGEKPNTNGFSLLTFSPPASRSKAFSRGDSSGLDTESISNDSSYR